MSEKRISPFHCYRSIARINDDDFPKNFQHPTPNKSLTTKNEWFSCLKVLQMNERREHRGRENKQKMAKKMLAHHGKKKILVKF